MKRIAKVLAVFFLASVALPIFGMKMPKGITGTWEGFVSGNHCAVMGMKCPPSHSASDETPVFVPLRGKNLDFTRLYYFVGLSREQQEEIFGKEIKVTGMLYPNISSVWAKGILVKEGKTWKPLAIPEMNMDSMKGSKAPKKPDTGY